MSDFKRPVTLSCQIIANDFMYVCLFSTGTNDFFNALILLVKRTSLRNSYLRSKHYYTTTTIQKYLLEASGIYGFTSGIVFILLIISTSILGFLFMYIIVFTIRAVEFRCISFMLSVFFIKKNFTQARHSSWPSIANDIFITCNVFLYNL